jgi:hypothetical protein
MSSDRMNLCEVRVSLAAAVLCAGVGFFAFCPNASADEGFGLFGYFGTAPAEQPPVSRVAQSHSHNKRKQVVARQRHAR